MYPVTDPPLPIPAHRQMAIGDWQDEERKREVEEANERSLAARVLESEAHAEWHARAREILCGVVTGRGWGASESESDKEELG